MSQLSATKWVLLLDENLSPSLVSALTAYDRVTHVREVSLRGAGDLTIWQWAKQNCAAIVTKDTDFIDLCTRLGPPPKVIQIRLGNCTTAEIAVALTQAAEAVQAFLVNPAASVLLVERQV